MKLSTKATLYFGIALVVTGIYWVVALHVNLPFAPAFRWAYDLQGRRHGVGPLYHAGIYGPIAAFVFGLSAIWKAARATM